MNDVAPMSSSQPAGPARQSGLSFSIDSLISTSCADNVEQTDRKPCPLIAGPLQGDLKGDGHKAFRTVYPQPPCVHYEAGLDTVTTYRGAGGFYGQRVEASPSVMLGFQPGSVAFCPRQFGQQLAARRSTVDYFPDDGACC
jgi:hypothetical protein